jgi:hypothetical protein
VFTDNCLVKTKMTHPRIALKVGSHRDTG